MPQHSQEAPILSLLGAVIDGKVPARDAALGLHRKDRDIFALAAKLGNASRGATAMITARNAALLYELIEDHVGRMERMKPPRRARERFADRIADLAFDLQDPMLLAINIGFARDSGKPFALVKAPPAC